MESSNATNPTESDGAAAPEAFLSTVPLRLPPFWNKNPRVWFHQIEAQFVVRRITAQSAKYYHVVCSVPSELADSLDDLQDAPSAENPHDELKSAILCRKMECKSSRLRQLLTSEELGDRRPTQLLHGMPQLLGERPSEAQSNLLGELFLRRLPANIRMILASASTMHLDVLAELADRIAEYALTAVLTVAATACTSSSVSLEATLQELAEAVRALQFTNQKRSSSSRRSYQRRRSPSGGRASRTRPSHSSLTLHDGLCWYQHRFSKKATRCTCPCTWQEYGPASN